ncbi:hypothetical protein THOG11_20211 [Vibrio harveyi]|nr:hypothetical protein TH15OA1_530189 [Vibrio harveyi]CAH1555847.1 hypothetical protein THOD03_20206 [Vibrio harveyi]CAH1562749.1 hypothetical protein THOG11_20211 [Vibrio harveyi]
MILASALGSSNVSLLLIYKTESKGLKINQEKRYNARVAREQPSRLIHRNLKVTIHV